MIGRKLPNIRTAALNLPAVMAAEISNIESTKIAKIIGQCLSPHILWELRLEIQNYLCENEQTAGETSELYDLLLAVIQEFAQAQIDDLDEAPFVEDLEDEQ